MRINNGKRKVEDLGFGVPRSRRNPRRTLMLLLNSGEQLLIGEIELERGFERDDVGEWGVSRDGIYRCVGSPYEEIHDDLSAAINGCLCKNVSGSVRRFKAIMLGFNSLNGLLVTPSTIFVLTLK